MLPLSTILNDLVELFDSEKHLSSGFYTADHCEQTQLQSKLLSLWFSIELCVSLRSAVPEPHKITSRQTVFGDPVS